MTPTEVKEAHDRIWAVKEKIGLWNIEIGGKTVLRIRIRYDIPFNNVENFETTEQVNQFLKGLDKPKEKQLGYIPANPYQDGLE